MTTNAPTIDTIAPARPEPQNWQVCYALPQLCSYRFPGGFHAGRCPDDAVYVAIRRDSPEQTSGWCEAHAGIAWDHSALYPARHASVALRLHIVLYELEWIAIPGEDDDEEMCALKSAADLVAAPIRSQLAGYEIRNSGR